MHLTSLLTPTCVIKLMSTTLSSSLHVCGSLISNCLLQAGNKYRKSNQPNAHINHTYIYRILTERYHLRPTTKTEMVSPARLPIVSHASYGNDTKILAPTVAPNRMQIPDCRRRQSTESNRSFSAWISPKICCPYEVFACPSAVYAGTDPISWRDSHRMRTQFVGHRRPIRDNWHSPYGRQEWPPIRDVSQIAAHIEADFWLVFQCRNRIDRQLIGRHLCSIDPTDWCIDVS